MRDIKFRAWNPEKKQMEIPYAVVGGLAARMYECSSDSPVVTVDGLGNFYKDWDREVVEPTWVLMQFTGLQDVNGNDIYEGDIVRSTSELIKPFASLHDEKTGVMVTKHKLIQFNDEKAYFTSGGGLPLSRKVCETYYHVVGNIHENQSLIDENPDHYSFRS